MTLGGRCRGPNLTRERVWRVGGAGCSLDQPPPPGKFSPDTFGPEGPPENFSSPLLPGGGGSTTQSTYIIQIRVPPNKSAWLVLGLFAWSIGTYEKPLEAAKYTSDFGNSRVLLSWKEKTSLKGRMRQWTDQIEGTSGISVE